MGFVVSQRGMWRNLVLNISILYQAAADLSESYSMTRLTSVVMKTSDIIEYLL